MQRCLSDLTRVSSASRLCNACGIITVQKECPASSWCIRGGCDCITLTQPQGIEEPQSQQCWRQSPEREKRETPCPRVRQVSHGSGVRAIRLPGEQSPKEHGSVGRSKPTGRGLPLRPAQRHGGEAYALDTERASRDPANFYNFIHAPSHAHSAIARLIPCSRRAMSTHPHGLLLQQHRRMSTRKFFGPRTYLTSDFPVPCFQSRASETANMHHSACTAQLRCVPPSMLPRRNFTVSKRPCPR